MRNRVASTLCLLFLSFGLIGVVRAADESFADQFLGSPLLVLVAVVLIDVIAFIYHRIRK